MNNIGTTTLRHPQLLYASSRTTQSSGKTTGSGTTNDDDGLQSAGTYACHCCSMQAAEQHNAAEEL